MFLRRFRKRPYKEPISPETARVLAAIQRGQRSRPAPLDLDALHAAIAGWKVIDHDRSHR